MGGGFIIALFYLICFEAVIQMLGAAPEGWEDEFGFHIGRER